MKKLFLLSIAFCAILFGVHAQTPYGTYNCFIYTNDKGVLDTVDAVSYDTLYVTVSCRNGQAQSLKTTTPGILTAQKPASTFDVGDSLTWKIIPGAYKGTIPRVRIVNAKTGEYLKYGTINGALTAYVGPFYDNVAGGQLDLYLRYQDDTKKRYYYICGEGNIQFFNEVSGIINMKNSTSTQGWALNAHKGAQPKAKMPEPVVTLTTNETNYYAGSSVTFNLNLAKLDKDLKGSVLMYNGSNFVDTLHLDTNGSIAKQYDNLTFGSNIFTFVYSGDDYYGALNKSMTLNVVAALGAKKTNLTISLPSTAEVHKNVVMDLTAKTVDGDVVSGGDVLVYVNGILKNRTTLGFMGTGSITFPNFLLGRESIKAVYIGNNIEYLNSDTASASIDIAASTSTVKPYPVYYDLSSNRDIANWEIKNASLVLAHKYSYSFRTDSLPDIAVSDTINNTHRISIVATGTTYGKGTDAYCHADYVSIPLGSSRPTSVKFNTPWLNAGSYNIYYCDRRSGDAKINISGATLDENELYFPSEEMNGRWFRSSLPNNNTRRWNAKVTDGTGMSYLGSVHTSTSGVHKLQINVVSENGNNVYMDMLQFIPVDQDSVTINQTAVASMAKLYYPMFSWLGFAYTAPYDVAQVPATYADYSNLALPYQVADKTDWGQKMSYTISGFTTDTVMVGNEPIYANYVTVYKSDRWTRVAEGYATGDTYSGELPIGNYYYETIRFTDLGDGAFDYRTLVKTGTLSLGTSTPSVSNNVKIKTFVSNRELNVRGIEAGAKIMVADITGRILVNTTSKATDFSTKLPMGVYVLKVVSGETLRTKILVK